MKLLMRKMFFTLRPVFHFVLAGLLTGLLVGGAGCGGGGNSSSGGSTASTETGEVIIGLTDARGDFVTYTVDVLSLTLERANGALVETLPATTAVDFAQYTEMTEFLSAATVPSGTYTKAHLRLDYSNANIQVEDEGGTAIAVSNVIDSDGNPVGILDVSVRLEGDKALVVAPGIPAHVILDFDLAATNRVVFNDDGNPTVTVEPCLVADVNPEESKIHRIRGPLKAVNTGNNSFTVIIRPFVHVLSGGEGGFGTLAVTVTESTIFEIDGTVYEGSAGLARLSTMPAFTAVVGIGDLKWSPRRFEATEVYAGSSVPGGTCDVVTGSVIKRTNDVLTVKGATLIRQDGSVVFNDRVTVNISDATVVRREFSKDPADKDAISIGQAITAFGQLSNAGAGQLVLDATSGFVRMLLNHISGTAVSVQPTLAIDLQAINGRRPGIFDFAGTGTTADQDADPDNYEISTGSLTMSSLSIGTPVKIRGFLRAFGQAPKDFEARTIIDVSGVHGKLGVNWFPVSSAAFTTITSEGMSINLSGHGLFHHVIRSGLVTDLTGLSTSPNIVPPESGAGLFYIEYGTGIQLFTSFTEFASELNSRIVEEKLVRRIAAEGRFADQTGVFTAPVVTVRLM